MGKEGQPGLISTGNFSKESIPTSMGNYKFRSAKLEVCVSGCMDM